MCGDPQSSGVFTCVALLVSRSARLNIVAAYPEVHEVFFAYGPVLRRLLFCDVGACVKQRNRHGSTYRR